MIRSMTGFGEASATADGVHVSVEIKALNNKFFKLTLRMPEELQGLEPDIDGLLRRRLVRGSTTVTIRYADTTATAAHEINQEALKAYIVALQKLPDGLVRKDAVDLATVMTLPGVLQPPSDLEERVERLRPVVLGAVEDSCDKLITMRDREGTMLQDDLHKHRQEIATRLDEVASRAPLVVEEYYEKLLQRVQRLLAETDISVEPEAVIREVAFFADRTDISEEVSRLSAHLTQFKELIDAQKHKPIGRTLDFLAQEMLREANTIASKSNDAVISRDIVEVKGAIDRIKEQVQNVE